MDFEIGLFRPGEGPACEAISAEVFGGLNIPFFLEKRYDLPGHGRYMNAFWARDLYQRHPETFLVARRGDRVLGFNGLTAEAGSGLGWVVHLGVAPEAQGQGIGRALVAEGLDLLREHDLPVAWIEYDRGNERAGGLYRRLGFVDFGGVRYFDAPVSASADPGPDPRRAESLHPLLSVNPDRPLFPEEALMSLYGLPLTAAEARAHYLALRSAATSAYTSEDGAGAFALVGSEAEGKVLHLPFFWAGSIAPGTELLRRLLSRAGRNGAIAAYAAAYEPSAETVAALEGAGFREIHALGCLAQPL